MAFALNRPETAFDPALGPLHAEQFQIAYATNDIESAKRLFAERLGIRKWQPLGGQMPSGGQIRVELAWLGTVMYELISASGPGSALYMDCLPDAGGFAMRHHHLGFLIHDMGQWDKLLEGAARLGWPVVHENYSAGFMRSCFIDAPELGHYLEYLLPDPAGLEFFQSVPNQ